MSQRSLFLLTVLLTLPFWTKTNAQHASSVQFRSGDLNQLKEQAKRESKLLFLNFTASWCMPCQWMDKHTFSDPQVSEMLNRYFVPVAVNIDDPQSLKAKDEYRIILLPSMLILDTRGATIGRYEESMAATRLLELLRRHFREQMGYEATITAAAAQPAPQPVAEQTGGSQTAIKPNMGSSTPNRPTTENTSRSSNNRPAANSRTTPTQGNNVNQAPANNPANTNRQLAGNTGAGTPPVATAQNRPKAQFAIQVAAFSSYENAVRQVEQLERKVDRPVQVFMTEQEGRRVYRVLIGEFDNREAADAYNATLNQRSLGGMVRDLNEL